MEFSRRYFLGALSGGAASFALPNRARSAERCWDNSRGRKFCEAYIPSDDFRHVYVSQQTDVWCWAATLAMIFDWHGKTTSQRSIVRQVYGAEIPTTIGPFDLMDATSRRYTADNGERFSVRSRVWSADFGINQLNNCEIIRELERERPLIVCNETHMMVLINIRYNADIPCNSSGRVVYRALVADPWPEQHVPGRPSSRLRDLPIGFRELRESELWRITAGGELRFLATVRVR